MKSTFQKYIFHGYQRLPKREGIQFHLLGYPFFTDTDIFSSKKAQNKFQNIFLESI